MIEVRRPLVQAQQEQPVWYDNRLIQEMKTKGVPATGLISLNGCTSGQLQIFASGNQMVYRWYAPGEVVQEASAEQEDDGEL